jgi:PAS domain S-box-containing protein
MALGPDGPTGQPAPRHPAMVDGAPDPQLSALARTAASALNTAIAMIKLTDGAEWRTRGLHGLDAPMEDHSFCRLALHAGGLTVVPDAAAHPDLSRAPAHLGPPHLRFYAGAPLLCEDGAPIGLLCVADPRPRAELDATARRTLADLAALAMEQLELRRQLADADARARADARRARMLAAAAAATDVETVASAAVDAVFEETGAVFCVILRLSADGQTLAPIGARVSPRFGDPDYAAALAQRPLRADQSGAGRCIREMRPLIVDDVERAEAEGMTRVRETMSLGARAMVMCPMALGADRYALVVGLDDADADYTRAARTLQDTVDMLQPLMLRLRGLEEAQLLRRVIDALSEGVMIAEAPTQHRPAPVVVHANPALCAMSGYRAEDLLGGSPFVLMGRDADDPMGAEIAAAIAERRMWTRTLPNLRSDGSTFWAEVSVGGLTDATGAVSHTVSIRRDVTAQRDEAARLADSEAAFRALFEKNPIPMWIFDRETLGFLEVNEAAVQTYGYSRAQFARMTLMNIRPPEDAAGVQAMIRGRAPGRLVHGPHRHFDAQGRMRYVELMSHDLIHHGRPAVLAAIWDVTERRAADAARREAQRLARIGGWRWRCGLPGPEWSVEALEAFGRHVDAAPDAILAAVSAEDRAQLDAALEAGAAFVLDLSLPDRQGGQAHFRIEGRPAAESGALEGFVQDVTDARRAEESLLRAEKLSAMGQLTGGVAHDFNNLLTVAMGNVEMAAAETSAARRAAQLDAVRSAIERGAALTGQLLTFARRQALRATDVPLAPFLKDLMTLLERSLGARHSIALTLDDPRLTAHCDVAQLEAALLNLLLNARDAMQDGGEIVLHAARADAAELAEAGLDAAAPMIAVSVRDSGPGIPPAMRGRVLEPFFTTKPAGQGTGLGLSMAQGFARQSGGEIVLVHPEAGGLEVRLLLPAARGDAPAATERRRAHRLPEGVEVLLVEDDAGVRATVRAMLEGLGAQVAEAPSGEAALALLKAGLRFDALFSDVVLGDGMDGLTLSRRARDILPDMAMVLTSGYNDVMRASDAGEGAPRLLGKPFTAAALREALAQALGEAGSAAGSGAGAAPKTTGGDAT